MVGGENSLKMSAPSSYGLGVMMFQRFGGKGSVNESINQSVTNVLVEQPRLHQGLLIMLTP